MSCYLNEELANVVFGRDGSKKFSEYQDALNVKTQMDQVKSKTEMLRSNFEENMKELDDRRAKLQEMCKHPIQKSLPNPAGERPERECKICGKIL